MLNGVLSQSTDVIVEALRVWQRSLKDDPKSIAAVQNESAAWRLLHGINDTISRGLLAVVQHDDNLFIALPPGQDVTIGLDIYRVLRVPIEKVARLN